MECRGAVAITIFAPRHEFFPVPGGGRCRGHNVGATTLAENVNTPAGSFDIQAEARGRHWVAWLTRAGDARPVRSVVIVGETRDEAERRAREWAGQLEPGRD